MYLLHHGMDITKAMLCQNLYWPSIRTAIRKEVTNFGTYQRKKRSNIKYVKLPSKESVEIPCNKICVYIIGPYSIIRKVNKENLNLKVLIMIDPVTGWFEIMQYYDKRVVAIANLSEAILLTRYPRPT